MAGLSRVSFGSTAAIVTSMGVISGLSTATDSKAPVVASLLVIAVADNLTDSLAIHVYQESELLESRRAFWSTVANFFMRLLVSLSFVVLVLIGPAQLIVPLGLSWGLLLLATLTYLVARHRNVSTVVEIGKHVGVAAVVVAASKLIGGWILANVS